MLDYYRCAVEALRGNYLAQSPDRLAYRPPLYPLFLASIIQYIPGAPLPSIRMVQAVLGALSAVMVYAAARLALAPLRRDLLSSLSVPYAAPLAAGLAFALAEGQIFFTGVLMTETLAVFLLLCWTLVGVSCSPGGSYGRLVVFSFLLGVIALVKPILLTLLPIVVFKTLHCLPKDKWISRAWLPALIWLAPILPWTLRNAFALGAFVLISTNSGLNFYIGQNPGYGYWLTGGKEEIRQVLEQELGYIDEVKEDRLFFRLGLKHLMEDPLDFFRRAGMKLQFLYLYEAKPWPWEEYNRGRGLVFPGEERWPLVAWNPVILPLVLAGIVYAFIRRAQHGVFLSVIVLYTFACLIYFARTRFRIPLEPYLFIYASLGLASMIDLGLWGYRNLTRRFVDANAQPTNPES